MLLYHCSRDNDTKNIPTISYCVWRIVLVFRSNRAGAVYQECLLKYNTWFSLAIGWLASESDENGASLKPTWDSQWWCHSLFHLQLITCTTLQWYECCWKWIKTLVHTHKHSYTHACLTPMFTCTHFDAYTHPYVQACTCTLSTFNSHSTYTLTCTQM